MSAEYQAGVDTSDVILSYGEEDTWAQAPAVAFQQVRMTGEGFSETKTRNRPAEIKSDGQAAHGVTTKVEAQGSLNFALSYGTYDDLLGGLLNNNWSNPLAIDSVGGDISADSAGSQFTSVTAGKFDTVQVGQWIKVFGFADAGNNGAFRVTAKSADGMDITVANAPASDEAGVDTDIKIRGTFLRNGTSFRTFYFQKKLANALFLCYPGSYTSGGQLQAQVGGYLEGSFSFLSKNEDKAVAGKSTGAEKEAPGGLVVDTVTGFRDLQLDDAALQAVAQSISVNITKNNARAQYGLGSPDAQGMGRGTIQVDGKLSVYFKDFTLYEMYKAESEHLISFKALDHSGAGYILTLPLVTLLNPKVVAGGPDSDVMAEFDIEANKSVDGFTLQIDNLPASAG